MQTKKIIYVVLICLIISACSNNSSKTVILNNSNQFGAEILNGYSNTVVCELKVSATVSKDPYSDESIADSNIETSPLQITITDIDTDYPTLIAGDGYKVDLIKPPSEYYGNEDMVYFFELTLSGNLNVYTLFRDQNILTLSKQYNMVGAFAYSMMGDCKTPNFSL